MAADSDDLGVPPIPEAVAQNPLLQSFLANPYPALAFARMATPVFHEPSTDAWVVTRFEDADEVLRSAIYGKDPRKAVGGAAIQATLNPDPTLEPSMLLLDPPDHTRLRNLVNKAFTPHVVRDLRPRIQQVTDELLDAVADRERFDVMAVLANPLPIRIIAEMIGVDPGDQVQFRAWSQAFAANLDVMATPEVREQARRARLEMAEFWQAEITARRAASRGDLISGLIAAQEGGDSLTDVEMMSVLTLLLVAGNVTTTDLIGNGVLALLEHPNELCKLKADPSMIGNAVEEMLRYDTPVLATNRIPLQDVEIHGCPIPARQAIVVSIAGANRDPSTTPDPDRFDISREGIRHASFGAGAHYCLGAPLARLEAPIAIGTLVNRFPTLRLDPANPPERRALPAFRGLRSLPVIV